jgi:hypothetical protein
MARFFAVTPKREEVRSPNMLATFAAVCKIALSLDNVDEGVGSDFCTWHHLASPA